MTKKLTFTDSEINSIEGLPIHGLKLKWQRCGWNSQLYFREEVFYKTYIEFKIHRVMTSRDKSYWQLYLMLQKRRVWFKIPRRFKTLEAAKRIAECIYDHQIICHMNTINCNVSNENGRLQKIIKKFRLIVPEKLAK